MHEPFKSANINFAEGNIKLTDGVFIDVLVGRIEDQDVVSTIDEISSLVVGTPKTIPLERRDEYGSICYATTLEEIERRFIWSIEESIPIYGLVCYSSNGYLLFTVDFGGIRESLDGAFCVTIPEQLVYFQARVSG